MRYLSRFLCAGFAVALLATGCASVRPLKGGKAITTRKPTGIVEQTLVQSENPAQATRQDQESLKVRTYTVPEQARRFGVFTDVQREAWHAAAATYRSHPRQGQSGPLTGLHLFIRVNCKLARFGLEPLFSRD